MQDSPIPQCYTAGQTLATRLLYTGGNGIYYQSVRDSGGLCVVCFRPAMVYKLRRGSQWTLAFNEHLTEWFESTNGGFEQLSHLHQPLVTRLLDVLLWRPAAEHHKDQQIRGWIRDSSNGVSG